MTPPSENPCTDSFLTGSDTSDIPGDEWTDLRLIHESARGWCRVYTCLHRGRRVVIKALKAEFADSPRHRELLRKEYEVGAMMNHPNIVSVLGLEDIAGPGLSIVMEHVDGMTLSDYIRASAPMDVNEIIAITGQICSALSYIHSRQMLHRDIKPSNIMLTRDSHYVRIIDFGMSHGNAFVTPDIPGGTEGFTAPECLLPGYDIVGPRADIYSLGCLLRLMQPRGCHRFDSIAKRCMAPCPADRPARVDDIMPLILRTGNFRHSALVISAIVTVVVCGIAGWWMTRPVTGDINTGITTIPVNTLDSMAVKAGSVHDTIVVEASTIHGTTAPKSAATLPAPTTTIEITPIADEQSPAPTVTIDIPIEEQAYRMARECAARRFDEHLNVMDTMVSARTNALTIVKHWRWLAREDVRHWLEGIYSPGNPHIETLMASVAKTVEDYGNEDYQAERETEHRLAAIRRDSSLLGATTEIAYPVGDTRICRKTLGEDGYWTIEVFETKHHSEYIQQP